MDLPPDKAKLLKNYDNEKKWDIICDQVSIWFVAAREMIHLFKHLDGFFLAFLLGKCFFRQLLGTFTRSKEFECTK